MKMTKVSRVAALLCAAAAVGLLGQAGVTEAVTCSPLELTPCVGAITTSQPPSRTCCDKLREQRPCLCGYLKDPNLSQYINSPNAKRIASACGVPTPTC